MNAIGAHRGESITVLTLTGEDTKVQHYLTDDEVLLLIETLQESARPRWVFAGGHNGWQCNRCRRFVEQDDRPAACECNPPA